MLLRAQIVCYKLKGDMFEQFENFEFARICLENHSSITGWQKLFLVIFDGHCNPYFWDIWLKVYSLPNFNMLFQLVLTSYMFHVYRKLITCHQLMYRRPIVSAHLGNRFPHCPIKFVLMAVLLRTYLIEISGIFRTCNISKVDQRTSRQHKNIVNLPLNKCCCCCWCYPFIFII